MVNYCTLFLVSPQPHHRLALPSKSLPISGQDSVTTSDLPTSSTQGGGNYGAIGIGRPPIRRSSVPANTQPPKQLPQRKISYGKLDITLYMYNSVSAGWTVQ